MDAKTAMWLEPAYPEIADVAAVHWQPLLVPLRAMRLGSAASGSRLSRTEPAASGALASRSAPPSSLPLGLAA